jgi:enamine deaminase RidA (YjgF/YER057c/UK114 family)
MFDNLHGLLAKAGMDLGAVVSATAYLKHAEYFHDFLQAASAHGLSVETPTEVVVAAICRPEWLCEIEVCAVQTTPEA